MDPDWTIAELLDWIGADDARCHDERLMPLLSALAGADASSTVMLVRTLAARVATEPGLVTRRVRDVRGARTTPEEPEPRGILIAV